MAFTLGAVLLGLFGVALCGEPHVPCPVPLSPEHGQVFLYEDGYVVKYVCEPGYALNGKELVRCIDGEWEDPKPVCLEFGVDGFKEEPEKDAEEPLVPPSARPLFSWGSDGDQEEIGADVNATAEDMPMSDEARVRLLMYPRRRIITNVRTARIQSASELEEEEKRRSQDKDSTTIHVDSSPSVVYVRRSVVPGKSETARKSLHMTVAENGDDVQLVTLPRAAVSVKSGYVYDPRYGTVGYHRSGSPVAMTLTESQLAWINSLHPELRDQYLKDLYVMRAEETVEGERALSFIRRYDDPYNYVYTYPYMRRPVSLIVEDPIAMYDYTCHESGYPFLKAPRLRNMHVARYDRRQNPNSPHNHYLSAVYRCNPGYYMLDTRYTELHCSKKDWIGVSPVCVRRT